MVWLIRAIINGNIIIQASISTPSHLNEYIFCLRAVAASELLKRNERKKKKKNPEMPLVQSLGGWGQKNSEPGTGSQEIWTHSLRSDPCSLCDLGQDLFSHLCCQENGLPCIPEPSGLWHCRSELYSYFKFALFYMLHLQFYRSHRCVKYILLFKFFRSCPSCL